MKRKNQLLYSVLSLLLCVSMLLGTTFAWFTDSVETGINTIAAGNLDVELYHSNAAVQNEKVDASTELFMDLNGKDILWEPGVVSYENLRVVNEGDLALAYQLALNTANENYIVDPATGAQYGLSQVLQVGVVEGGITATDRDSVVASVAAANWTTLANFLRSGSLLPEGAGESEKTWGVVIYWKPGVNDNFWNLNNGKTLNEGDALTIDLGVKLIATQEVYENDSFGDDYDTDAKAFAFPDFVGGSATAAIEVDAQGRTVADVTMTSGKIKVFVPAGVQVKSGVTKLSMSVSEMTSSGANVSLGENEDILSLDVHVEGVADNNTVPITVTLAEVAPTGLNMGNYKLYHVESTGTKEMTLVDAAADFDAHNQFKYDPATGDVALHMATFSEVAVVAEPPKWEGKFDYTWYTNAVAPADGEAVTEYVIANADQLAGFGAIVGGMNGQTQDSFSGKTVKLISDINLGDKESENNPDIIFYPIGYYNSEGTYERTNTAITSGLRNFEGTFDGNGHTVSNFYQNTWEMKGDHNWYSPEEQYYRDGMGLFGRVYKGTVKNLTVKEFKSDGEITTTGCIAAYADGATFENIAIFDCNPRVYNIGNGGIVGCVGWYAKEANLKTTFKNITVDNSNKISALWGSYDVACGGIVGQYYVTSGQSSANTPKNGGIHFENCHISAQMDVYNDVCANYQYYAYRYTGMLIGSVSENVTIDGHSYPKMDKITAKDCTVHFGTWNDYYYCEFEKNGHPSYSGPDDYKFSRIPHSEINFTDSNGNGIIDTEDERASVTGCKHTHTAAEDQQCVYLEFNNLVTGYGWGVTSKGVDDLDGVKILDREVGNSVEKFEGKVTELANNKEYKLGDIFKFVDKGVKLIPGALAVSVNNLDENNPVSAKFVCDSKNWENGIIKFTGTGEVQLTIQDYYFCTPTTITVTITERQNAEKFDIVMNNGDFLHRVGNSGTVALDKLFKAKDGVSVGTVSVTVEPVNGSNASGTYSNNAIQFSDTGIVKVTITDNDYCIPAELNLEVVDAVNATAATSATKNNVVLLNDCGFSSLEVSGGYTLFGNGFTMSCGSDSAALDFGYSFVTLDNGTLDNVQIICPNFDYAALYKSQLTSGENRSQTTDRTRYYNAKSGVSATGNSQILNSRISGGRATLNISNGNVVVDNSCLELGAVATVLISAANSVTFRDVILVQKPTESTYKAEGALSGKTLMGMSVLYMCDEEGKATPTTLEGSFVQYAWADSSCTAYMPNGTESIASTVLGKDYYTHNINGITNVNLGFAYMSDGDSVEKPSNIDDKRTDKDNIPYDYEKVKANVPMGGLNASIETYVYSYKNTKGTVEAFKTEPEYNPNKYSDIIVINYNDTAEGVTIGKTYGINGWVYELNVDLDKLVGYVFDFNKLSMSINGVVVPDYKVNGNAKPTAPVAVSAGATTYTLNTTIGGQENSATLVITGVETSKRAPELISSNWADADHVTGKSGLDSVYSVTAKVLEGLTIRYWSVKDSSYIDLDLKNLTPTDKTGKINGTERTWSITDADNDYTLTVTSTSYVHSGNKLYAMPVVYNDAMYFVVSSSNGMVKTSNGARTMTISYVFKDNNGGELAFEHTWSADSNTGNAISYSTITSEGSGSGSSGSGNSGSCVAPDTLITLADGTQKRVDQLKGDELLLVWNLKTGKYEAAPIVFVDSEEETEYEIIHLYFSDGSDVKVIYEHGFFNLDLGKYVYIDASNYADYVGHRFVAAGDIAKGNWNVVTLDEVVIETEMTTAWSPVTFEHLCYYTNGVLSMPGGIEGLFNIFDVDTDTMTYDAEKMQQDIETYGLFTLEDFGGMISEAAFEAFNGAYLKVAMAKGLLTWEDIAYMAERYIPLM